jgi:hypothetical protein
MHHTFIPDSIAEAGRQIWAIHQATVDKVAVQLHLNAGSVGVVRKILSLNTECTCLLPH